MKIYFLCLYWIFENLHKYLYISLQKISSEHFIKGIHPFAGVYLDNVTHAHNIRQEGIKTMIICKSCFHSYSPFHSTLKTIHFIKPLKSITCVTKLWQGFNCVLLLLVVIRPNYPEGFGLKMNLADRETFPSPNRIQTFYSQIATREQVL